MMMMMERKDGALRTVVVLERRTLKVIVIKWLLAVKFKFQRNFNKI